MTIFYRKTLRKQDGGRGWWSEELPLQEGRGDDRQHHLQAPLPGLLCRPAQLHGTGRDHSYIRQHHLKAPQQGVLCCPAQLYGTVRDHICTY